jgi:two-component system LytT family sensor kinase
VHRTLIKFAAIWGVWSLLALLLAGASALYRINLGEAARFWQTLQLGLFNYWIWAALTPVIFYLAKKFPFSRNSWARATAIHFGFYLLLTFAHELIAQAVAIPAGAPAFYHGSILRFRFVSSLYEDLWMYWPVIVVWSLFEYYERFRERDTRAAQLKEQLARAELHALRSQLHPHFLFNTLNSIASLMHDDVDAADDMLADLSLLLRVYLSCHDQQEVPLQRELALLETYVGIQKRRFEDRLLWISDVPPDLLHAAIPALLLQPLVENSIVHGIAPRSSPGQVRFSARKNGSRLDLEIADNGLGLAANYTESIGLSNTRARLRQLYEDRCSFEMTAGNNGGVVVTISIPLRFLPAQSETDLHNPDPHDNDHTHLNRRRRTPGTAPDSVASEAR